MESKRYKLVRKFYLSTKDMEIGKVHKEYTHPFTPLTLKEAQTIKPKLMTPKNAIEHIVELTTDEIHCTAGSPGSDPDNGIHAPGPETGTKASE